MKRLTVITILFLLNQFEISMQLIHQRRQTTKENLIDELNIDLKQFILQKNQSKYLYKLNDEKRDELSVIAWSKLHSNQLSDEYLNRLLRIENKTNILINANNQTQLNRLDFCLNMKYCQIEGANTKQCVLNLNLLVYLTDSEHSNRRSIESVLLPGSQSHFSQIKIVRLSLIVNNLAQDNLYFDKFYYEFQLDLNALNNETNAFLGQISATNERNADLNRLVRYYLDFKSESERRTLSDLFKIDQSSGKLTFNKSLLLADSSYQSIDKYEFYVDALMQCSFLQKAIFNRTLIRINLLNSNKSKPHLKVTHLIQTKQFNNSSNETKIVNECLKLTSKEINSNVKKGKAVFNSIALTQITIENRMNTSSQFYLTLEPYTNKFKVQLKHLIDDIYVIYFVTNQIYNQEFLTDLYKIELNMVYSVDKSVRKNLFLCINSIQEDNVDLHEETSLIQFDKSINRLQSAFQPIWLSVNNLLQSNEEEQSNSKYSLAFKSINLPSDYMNHLSIEKTESQVYKLEYVKPFETAVNEWEKSQYELMAIGLMGSSTSNNDVLRFEQEDMQHIFANIYNNLTSKALENAKFLRFTSKILINTDTDTLINDWSIIETNTNNYKAKHTLNSQKDNNAILKIYKFYTHFDSLVNNSVIGYLDNIHDLKRDNLLTFKTEIIKNYSYVLMSTQHNDCFKLNKYDGVLKFSTSNPNQTCSYLDNDLIKLDVGLLDVSGTDRNIEKYAQVWIYLSRNLTKKYMEINSNAINLVYDESALRKTNSLSELEQWSQEYHEYNLNFKLNFNLNTQINSFPSFIRLVNLITIQSSSQSEQLEYKTRFELVDQTDKDLFLIDSKRSSLYLNTLNYLKLSEKDCFAVELEAKNFAYSDALNRKLLSRNNFKINLCFIHQSDPSSTSNLHKFSNQLIYRSFISPLLNSNYEHLLRHRTGNDLVKYRVPIIFVLIIASFIISALFIIAIVYLFTKGSQQSKKKAALNNMTINQNYHNFYSPTSSKLSIVSSENSKTNSNENSSHSSSFNAGFDHLKIRNDLSKYSHQDGQNLIYSSNQDELSGKMHKFMYKQEEEFEKAIEKYKTAEKQVESSEDQGVYCVPTGTSLSLSSNISSVSTSQFGEAEVDSSFHSRSSISIEMCKENRDDQDFPFKFQHSNANDTRLSLFEMTLSSSIKPNYFLDKSPLKSNEDMMRNWLAMNRSINIQNQIKKPQIPSRTCSIVRATTTINQDPSILIGVDTFSECII